MVDPNPARGMPAALQRYWLVGKGAAKIRWGMPHDFNRCVRNLRKYFPKNPEGLCNILHQKRMGAPPGQGHGHSMTAAASMFGGDQEYSRETLIAATELLNRQPELGRWVWAGPIAPIGVFTGEPRRRRIFEKDSLRHRMLPLPMAFREHTAQGHDGAVTVGRFLGLTYGPDHLGKEHAFAWGDFLDEDIIPEAKKARYLMEMGVLGASVDPGGEVIASVNPETGAEHMMRFTIGGATLVPIPAFSGTNLYAFDTDGDWPDDDPDLPLDYTGDDDCGCGPGITASVDAEDSFTVNSSGWRGLPLAPRDAVFDNDDALKRIIAWAATPQGVDVQRLQRAFMWRDPRMPETDTTSYRLPVGDIINGELTLIYHAIYAAAALLSGAHGGLPNVPEVDKGEIRRVISDIYPVMAKEFNDGTIRAPWDRSIQPGVQLSMDEFASDEKAKEPYGDVKYADPGYQGDKKKRYPLDTPDHVRAAWSYINMPKNAGKYSPEQLKTIKARIRKAMEDHGIEAADEDEASMSRRGEDEFAMSDLLQPPKQWFDDPKLDSRTPLTVTADGRVYGHIAAWDECHRDFLARRECVLPPRSRKGYAPFHLGSVLTAEGDTVRVGKIVMDTRHADINMGYNSAALHYDNTGDEVAVVRAGEDQYGVWVAGAVVPEAGQSKVAKLRRSPISGDWRRVDGNLELTAALAVNVPAFPVYAMDGEEQLALVAAGTVMPVIEPEPEPAPPTGVVDLALIAAAVRDEINRQAELEERRARLADLVDDEAIYARRLRESRLATIVAAAGEPAPATEAPAAAAPAPTEGAPVEGQADEAGMLARQMDAQFSIVEDPAGASTGTTAPVTPAPTPAPVG